MKYTALIKLMFDIKIDTEPASELITTAEVKEHLAITHTEDDTYIGTLISQVRSAVETWCGISIGSQTRTWAYDFDTCEWPIPYGPVISVTGVTRKTGTSYEALDTTDYDVDGVKNKVISVVGGGRCKVTYTTGYTTLPAELKRGMLEEIAYRYEHRGDTMSSISEIAKSYLVRYKDFNWE